MRDVNAVCAALAEAVRGVPGLTCFDVIPDPPASASFYVAEIEIDFNARAYSGNPPLDITCRVVVPRGDNAACQRVLRRYMDPSGEYSVRAALQAAAGEPGVPALDGLVDDLNVTRQQGHRMYDFGTDQLPGFELLVHVI